MAEPYTVQGTFVVGDAGTAWVDSALTPDEERQAEAWLRRHHVLGPGFSATLTWLRSKRVLGSICPRQSCRTLTRRTRSAVIPDQGGKPGSGYAWTEYACDRCGRTYRIIRTGAEDVLEVLT